MILLRRACALPKTKRTRETIHKGHNTLFADIGSSLGVPLSRVWRIARASDHSETRVDPTGLNGTASNAANHALNQRRISSRSVGLLARIDAGQRCRVSSGSAFHISITNQSHRARFNSGSTISRSGNSIRGHILRRNYAKLVRPPELSLVNGLCWVRRSRRDAQFRRRPIRRYQRFRQYISSSR